MQTVSIKSRKKAFIIKAARNTQSTIDRARPVYHLCVPILCPNCGSPMGRRSNRECRIPQRWACKNPQCRTWIGIADEALLGRITDLLNDVSAHPERLQASADAYTPSDTMQRLEAEIRQMLERGMFDKAVPRQKMSKESTSLIRRRHEHSTSYPVFLVAISKTCLKIL